jgi:hypothetical protein
MAMIRKLVVVALLALVLAPLVSLRHLEAVEARASLRIVKVGAAGGTVTIEALLAATRL